MQTLGCVGVAELLEEVEVEVVLVVLELVVNVGEVVVDGSVDVLEVEVEVVVGCELVDVVVPGGGPALLVPLRDPTYALKLYFWHVLAMLSPP